MKVRDVIKLIQKDGWYLARTGGSHLQFKHHTTPGSVTVARKLSLDMPPGTLNSILKQAGLKKSERNEIMKYAVIIEQGETSYGAYVPDLPGCLAVGESEEEVRRLIAEAIAFHLDGLREEGTAAPEPHSQVEYVEVKSAA